MISRYYLFLNNNTRSICDGRTGKFVATAAIWGTCGFNDIRLERLERACGYLNTRALRSRQFGESRAAYAARRAS